MINIKELNRLSKILNLHELCEVSDLKYKTIQRRLLRHRINEKWGFVTTDEAEKILQGLEKYNLNYKNVI